MQNFDLEAKEDEEEEEEDEEEEEGKADWRSQRVVGAEWFVSALERCSNQGCSLVLVVKILRAACGRSEPAGAKLYLTCRMDPCGVLHWIYSA